jgi:hypothetical protein
VQEVLAAAERVQARPVAAPSDEWQQVAAHGERVAGWLALKRPLKRRKIHTLLKRDHGVTASCDTLRRFAIESSGEPTLVQTWMAASAVARGGAPSSDFSDDRAVGTEQVRGDAIKTLNGTRRQSAPVAPGQRRLGRLARP